MPSLKFQRKKVWITAFRIHLFRIHFVGNYCTTLYKFNKITKGQVTSLWHLSLNKQIKKHETVSFAPDFEVVCVIFKVASVAKVSEHREDSEDVRRYMPSSYAPDITWIMEQKWYLNWLNSGLMTSLNVG